MPTGQTIDNNYFIEKYLSQTLTDYSTLIKELQTNNKLSLATQLKLEASARKLQAIPSDKEWVDLTSQQQQDIQDTIAVTNDVQREVWKQVKPTKSGKANPQADKQAHKTWGLIMKTANNLQMYVGSIKQHKASQYEPQALRGTIPTVQRKNMQKLNADRGAQDKDILKKVQQMQQANIYPPTPLMSTPANSATSTKGGSEDDSYAEKAMLTIQSIMKGAGMFIDALGKFAGQVGSAYATMMNAFGSILDSPLDATIGMMQGMSQMIQQGYALIQDIFNTIADTLSSIVGVFTAQGDEKGGGKVGAVGQLVSSILGVISSLFNMVVQSIQQGFNIFASTLQAIFKIVKKIQNSSPIIRQILDLLNLAFTLFFMPFMNQFALSLLDTILQLLEWAVETGETFGSLGQNLLSEMEQEGINIGDILKQVEEIAVGFITKFLPDILELIPDLLSFAIDFANTILNNKDQLINFIKVGLSAFTQLLESGLLSDFLKFGTDVMKWVSQNAVTIVTFIGKILNQALNVASFFMGFVGKSSEQQSLREASASIEDSAQTLVSQLPEDSINTDESQTQYDDYEVLAKQASGGKFVHSMNGGIPVLAGEGNENEYKLSERELKEIGKDTTVSVQYNGSILSKNDFKQVVRTTVSDISNKSYFR